MGQETRWSQETNYNLDKPDSLYDGSGLQAETSLLTTDGADTSFQILFSKQSVHL